MTEAAVPNETDKVSVWLEGVVLRRIAGDELVLPTIHTVVAKGLEILRRPEISLKDVTALLERDPLLAARALRLACSAAMGGRQGKLTLVDAMARIGVKGVKTLLLEGAGQKIFVSKNPLITASTRKIWEHSLAVAALSRDLAALAGNKSGETAYLGGLLHDLGKPVVASLLLEAERQVVEVRNQKWIDTPAWLDVLGRIHRKVGIAVAAKWDLPDEVARCIGDCSEYDNSDRTSVVNSVCLANALAKQGGYGVGPVDMEDVEALVMIGRSLLGVGQDVLAKLAGDLHSRVTGLFE
jgi:putative nucleotidyltransferase with HDIG domain